MSLKKELKAGNLHVKIFDSRVSLGANAEKEAVAKIKELLAKKDEVNIIFASAPSQNEFLAALAADKEIDWSRINAFHLDEYIKLDPKAPQGFANFIKDRLFSKVNCKSVNYLNGNAEDIEAECERYSALLRKYPADVVCMGIGENGHIAFNDPPVADFKDKKLVKAVELEQKCRQQQVNDGCFDSIDKVPTHALSLTVPAIISGKYIFCMVPGKTKAEAVAKTIKDSISEACPSTILRNHENAILYADMDSASKIA